MTNLSKRDQQALKLLTEKGSLSLFGNMRIDINSKSSRKSIEISLYNHLENLEKLGLAKINYNSGLVFSK